MQPNMRTVLDQMKQGSIMNEPNKEHKDWTRDERKNIPEGYMTSQEAARLFDVTRGRAQYILKELDLDYYVIKNDRNNVHVYKEEDVWGVYVRRCEERRVKPGENRAAPQNLPASVEGKLH